MKRAAILTLLVLTSLCAWHLCRSHKPPLAGAPHPTDALSRAADPLTHSPKGVAMAHVRPFTVPSRQLAGKPPRMILAKPPVSSETDPARFAAVKSNLLAMPLHFEENRGQAPAQYDYLSHGRGCSVFLRSNEARIVVADNKGSASVGLTLEAAANDRKGVGLEPLAAKMNYYRGNDPAKWQVGVPTDAKVKYPGVYPGIDVVYYGNQRKLEYDFVVAPHADPTAICWNAEGADSVKLDQEGALVLTIGGHDVRIQKPLAYQLENGKRKIVEAGFRVERNRIRFALGGYDSGKALVIDPIVQFVYSTYLGGTTGDAVNAVAVDRQGRIYVTGWSLGTNAFPVAGTPPPTGTFPIGTTPGYVAPFQATHAADSNKDAFFAILSADMSEILYATYLGGSASDEATCLALDPQGNVYIGGKTTSPDYPTMNPAQSANAGGMDGFVTKLANNGTMIYSTYIGTAADDWINGIGVTSTGDVRVVGSTGSPFFYGHTPAQPGTTQDTFTISVKIAAQIETTNPIYEEESPWQEPDIVGALNNVPIVGSLGYFTAAYPMHKDPRTNTTQRTYEVTFLQTTGTTSLGLLGGTTTGVFPSVTLVSEPNSNSSYVVLPYGTQGWPERYYYTNQYFSYNGSEWPIYSGTPCITSTTAYPVVGGTAVIIAGTSYRVLNDGVGPCINYNGADWPVYSGTAYVTTATTYPIVNGAVRIAGASYPIYSQFIQIDNTTYPVVGNSVTVNNISFTSPIDGAAVTISAGSYPWAGGVVNIPELDVYTVTGNTVDVGGTTYPVVTDTTTTPASLVVTIGGDTYTVTSGTFGLSTTTAWPVYNGLINIDGHNWPAYGGGALVWGNYYHGYTLDIRVASGLSDGFALSLTGTALPTIDTAGSYIIGGPGEDSINGIATDLNGTFYFAGQAEDPTKQGTVSGKFYYPMIGQATRGGINVVEFRNEGQMNAVAVDLNGYSYFAGTSGGQDFPTYNAFETYPQTLDRSAPGETMGSGYNGIVVKMDPGFANTIFSTYLGGSKHDYATGIAVDFRGYVYVTGETESIDFPTLGDASQQSSDRNHGNAFLSVLVPAGNELRYSTYFGGAEVDWGFGVAVSPIRNPIAYVVGYTNSDDFPTTPGTIYPTSRQPDTYTSGFVTAFQDPTVDLELESITTDLPVPIAGQQMTYTVTVKNLSTAVDCQDARVSQLLSSNLTFVSAQGANIQNFTGGSVDTTTNTVSVDLGPVLAGREVSYTVTVLVNAPEVISTTATVQAEYDNNSTNNSLTLQQIARPLVSLAVTQPQASEDGTPGIFTVSRLGDLSTALSIKYTISGSCNSTNGVNYQLLSGSVALPVGSASANIVIAPYANTTAPNPALPKTVALTIQKGVNYELGTVLSGTVTIADVTADVVSLAIPDPTGSKNSGDPIGFTINRTGNLGQAMTVTYNLFGTATNGIDYQITGDNNTLVTGTTGTVTIPANTTSVNITAVPIPDSISGQPTQTTSIGIAVAMVAQTGTAPGSAYVLGAVSSGTATLLDVNPDTVTVAKVADAYASGTAGKFTITRSGDATNLTNALAVQYTMGGTAISGSDYTALSGVATIPAGSASVDVVVNPILNITGSTDKTAILTLSPTPNPKAYTLGAGMTDTVTIWHYAGTVLTVATPQQVPATATATGTTTGMFVISRTGSTTLPVTVYYSMGGSAASGVDFQPLPLSGTIPAGAAQLPVILTPLSNGLTSGSETATLILQPTQAGDYLAGTPGSASVTIINNSGIVRPLVTLSVISNDASLTSGSGVLVFRVTRSGDLSQAISVNYTTGGSAINGSDYQALTGAIALPANVATADIVVTPVWSNTVQPVKIVSLALAAGNDYDLGSVVYGTGSIDFPNNPVVSLSVVTGSASGVSGYLDFLVTRSGNTAQAISVNYATGGSAVNGVDYQPLTGAIALPAGVANTHIIVTPIWTPGVKQAQVFTVQLATGSGYGLGANTFGSGAIGYVPWDVVNVSVPVSSISESGSTSADFQVTRTGDTTQPITVNYTMGGTAVSGVNYQPVTGSVVILAGTTSADVLIAPINAHSSVSVNTVTLALASGTGYTTGAASSGLATISSAQPTVSLAIAGTSTITQTSGTLVFQVSRTGDVTRAISVGYTMGGTALNGSDYVGVPGTVVLAAGVSSSNILVVPIWTAASAAKTVSVQLGAGSDYVLGASTAYTGTILPVPWDTVSVGNAAGAVSETGTSGNLTFQVTRTGDTNQPITVNYSMAGSAVSGVNYQPPTGSVTILAGTGGATIQIAPLNAGSTVPYNTVLVGLAAGSYNIGGAAVGSGTITSANPVVSLAINGTNTVTQTSGTLDFRVIRGGDTSNAVAVAYTLLGSAANGVDYQSLPATVAFAAGSSTADILVSPAWTGGPDKVVTVQLAAGSGYVLSTGAIAASGAIQHVDLDGVSLSAQTGSVSETGSNGSLSFLVTRTGDTHQPLVFNYTLGGSAVSGVNYTPATGSVTIPAGTGTGAISIAPINANSTVPYNTVIVNAASGVGYTAAGIASVLGTIVSANPVVSVAITGTSTVTQTAGTLNFQVVRGGDISKAVSVSYTMGGSASNGVDYQSLPGTIAFPAGTGTVNIPVKPIWTGGPDKVVSLQIAAGSGYVVGSGNSASGAITSVALDGIALSVVTGQVSETGTSGNVVFEVTRTGDLTQAISFNYSLAGSAVAGVNYVPVSGSVTILAGSGTAGISIAPMNDYITVPFNTVVLNAASGGGYVAGGVPSVSGTIMSASPVVSIGGVLVNGTAGSTVTQTSGTLDFRVTRGGDLSRAVSVNYTMGGSALAGVDYVSLPGSVAFAAGASTADIYVAPVWTGGADKVVSLQLGTGSGYVLGSGSTSASGVIASVAWGPVTVSVTPASVSESGSNGSLTFALTRIGDLSQAVKVGYSLGGSAVAGLNYIAASGTATIPVGSGSVGVVVTPINAGLNVPSATVVLSVNAGSGYSLGAVASATASITSAAPVVGLGGVLVNGTNWSTVTQTSGTLDFQVTRGGDLTHAVAVNYSLGGSALNGVDYASLPGSVAFAAGASTADIYVKPIWTGGADKVVTINLAAGASYVLSSTSTSASGAITQVMPDGVSLLPVVGMVSETGSNGNLTFAVNRTGDNNQPLAFNYSLGGSAVSGVNFVPVSGLLTIPAGATSGTISIAPLNAGINIPSNSVVVSAAAGIGYTSSAITSATGAITSAAPWVSIAAPAANVTQTSGTLDFVVTRGGDLSRSVAVNYSLAGSAANGVDYQSLPGSVAFLSGSTTAHILVKPIWTGGPDKTVRVQLGTGVDYALTSGSTIATGGISGVAWDGLNLSTNGIVSETGSNGNLNFVVTRTGDMNQPLVFNYTLGGSAVAGVNYLPLSGSVTIAALSTSGTISVTPVNANITVPWNTITVTPAIGLAYTATGMPSITGTITSANTVVGLVVNGTSNVTQTSGTLDFQVTRGGDISKAVAVNYTMGGSALNGVDYQSVPGTLTFAAGNSTVDVFVTPIWTGGADKTVTMQLGAGTGYVLGGSNTFASGAITRIALDSVSLAAQAGTVSESGSNGNLAFLVTRGGDMNQALVFNYTLGGSAVSGVNYTAVSGSITIPAAIATGTIAVTPINANLTIPWNTVVVSAASGIGYSAAGISSVTGTITSANPVVGIAISGTSTVTQTSGTLDFQVTRGGDISHPAAVNYTLAGSGINGTDYQMLPGTAVFGGSTATAHVYVSPIWTGGPSRTVIVNLGAGTGYVLGSGSTSAVGAITHVDLDTVSLAVQSGLVSETGTTGNLGFVVTRGTDTNQPITFNYTLGGSAVSGTNYIPVSGFVTIPAGATSGTIAVAPINANSTVQYATVVVSAATGSGYVSTGIPSVTGTIVSANPIVSVATDGTNSVTQTTGPLLFRITRSGDISKTVVVNYTLGGSAVSGTDYQSLPGSVAFLAGINAADISVYPIWNSASVSAKSVSLQIGTGSGYVVSGGGSNASGWITQVPWDNVGVTVSSTSALPGSVSETGSNGNLIFTLTRNGDTNAPITVNYTMGGTALSGTHYVPLSGAVTISASSASATVPVIPINTNSSDPFKTVTMTVAPGTGYAPGTGAIASGTIISANPTVSVALNGAAAIPQTSGSLVFQVSRGGDPTRAIAVNYTLGGSAVAGVDYQNVGGSVAFVANALTANIVVRPIWTGTTVDKVVSIQLTNGAGYVMSGSSIAAAGTIQGVPFDTVNVGLASGSGSIVESNTTGNLPFQVTRTGDVTQPITVNYLMGGSAVSNVNYQPVTGQVTILAGTTSATIPVTPIDAHTTVPSRTVSVTLTSGTYYNIGTTPLVTGTITSEYSAVSIIALNTDASQTGSGAIVFQVSRPSDSSANAISVNYTLGGGAVNGDDYQTIPTSIALAAGASNANITITPIWGTTYKPAKAVTVQMIVGTGYVLGDSSLASGYINFPNFPQVNLAVPTPEALLGSGQVVFQVTRPATSATNAITVNYTMGGTAVSGSDFTALPGSVSLGVGVSSTTVVVIPNWTGNPRPVKTVSMQLTTGNNYVLGSTTYGAGTIDFVESPLVNVSVYGNGIANPPSVSSSNNGFWFVVTRGSDSASTANAITVKFNMGGSAVMGQDYMSFGTAVVLPAGVSTAYVDIVPLWANTAKTGPDSVTIQLTDGTGYKLGGTTYASGVINWPSEPIVGVFTSGSGIASLNGSNSITFMVVRGTDANSVSQPIQVSYVLGGNAVFGTDYQAYTGTMDPTHTVVLPAGSSTAAITVVPNWSNQVQPVKLVTIQLLGGASGGYLVSPYSFAQGTINFPNAPEVDLTLASGFGVAMQGTGSGTVVFNVTRTIGNNAISVNYTMGGSALNGSDYQLLPGTISLAPGVSSTTIVVSPRWANGSNSVQLVSAQITQGVGYVLGPNTYGSGLIDFPNYPEVDISVVAGAATATSGTLGFQVTRTGGDTSKAIAVSYTMGGTAVNGVDYQSLSGNVTLPAGVVSANFAVCPIWTNAAAAASGSAGSTGTTSMVPLNVDVSLANGSGYVVGPNNSAIGYIAPVPWDVVTVATPQPAASETGTNGLYRVTRTGDTTLPITVDYIMDGSAVNGVNYQTLNGTVTIASGSASADIVLAPINTGVRQPLNTAVLTVVSGTCYQPGVPASGTATIASANPWDTVSLTTTVNDASQASGTGLLIFHVSRSGSATAPVQIPFVLGGDAVSGVDYQPITASIDGALAIVLPVGCSGTDIVITPIWTTQVKPVKLVTVQIQSGNGFLVGANSFGQGTIDFPNYPEVNLSILSNNASNNASGTSALIFQVTRTGDTSKAIAVSYSPGGNASPGDDYQVLPGTISLPAGVSSTTIVVVPNWSNSIKPSKLVSIQLTAGAGYVLGSNIYGAGTLNFPNDPVVNVNVLNAVASQTGTSYIAFQVTRTGDLSQAVAVNYQTGGNAAPGTDYTALPGYVVLSPSVSAASVIVLPTWASGASLSKLMSLQISAGTGYVLGSNTYGEGFIQLSSSTGVSLAVIRSAATSGSGTLVFRVNRTGDFSQSVSVNYNMGGSAVSGADYVPVAGSVTLGIGVLSADIVVTPIWTAGAPRPDRTVTVQLNAGAGYVVTGAGVGTGSLSDTPWDVINLSVPQPNASESGTTAIFRVARSGSGILSRALTINYTTGGDAVSGLNYQPLSGSVTIPVGGTSADIVVDPLDDHVNTPDRTLTLTLATGQYYLLGSSTTGLASIANVPDNSLVSLSSVVSGSAVNSSGTGSLVFQITRTGNINNAILVNYSIGGSAVDGVDYQPVAGSVAMPAFQTTVDIVMVPIWLATAKLPQVVTVQLASGNGYDLTGNTFGTGTIFYNAWNSVSLSVLQPAVNETTPPLAVFQLNRTGDLSQSIVVNYTTGGSAVSGVNYAPLSGSAIIPAGASAVPIVVTPLDDHVNTAANTLTLTLTGGTNYNPVAPVSGAMTIANVPDNTISVGVSSQASESGRQGVFTIYRTGLVDKALPVYYSTGGNAVGGRDYAWLPGVVTIPTGATSATVVVSPLANTTTKISPTVKIALNPSMNYTIGGAGAGIVTIQHYTGPVLSVKALVSSVRVTGGPKGVFRISRGGSMSGNLSVRYSLHGTATNGYDFKKLSGTVTIPARKTYVDLTLVPINRSQPSGIYAATLTLAANSHYVATPANAATVNIRSFGPVPVSVAADPTAASNWEGYGVVRAIFTRTGSSSDWLTVYYTTGGTAVAGVNYTAVSGSVSFPPGQSSVGVDFNTIDDQRITPDMALIISLKAGGGYTITSPSQCTLTIKDADLKGPSF